MDDVGLWEYVQMIERRVDRVENRLWAILVMALASALAGAVNLAVAFYK